MSIEPFDSERGLAWRLAWGVKGMGTERLLRTLRRHALGARRALEIGSDRGMSTVAIATAMEHDGILFCVDAWWLSTSGLRHAEEGPTLRYRRFVRAMVDRALHRIVAPICKTSEEAGLEWLADDCLDLAYIDGCHTLECATSDIRRVAPKVRPSGVLALHDVGHPGPFGAVKSEWRAGGALDRWVIVDAILNGRADPCEPYGCEALFLRRPES